MLDCDKRNVSVSEKVPYYLIALPGAVAR